MDISQQVKDLIHQVVEQDEGRWVLTHNPNDPDGGWTFGGIIAPHWLEYIKHSTLTAYNTTEDIRVAIEQDIADGPQIKQLWIDRGIEIYYTKFYQPLPQDPLPNMIELSCAINIGVQGCCNIIAEVSHASDYEKYFCKAWMDYYIQLVEGNAKAWRDFGQKANTQHPAGLVAPVTLRAEFLQGWFNRVWRYLP